MPVLLILALTGGIVLQAALPTRTALPEDSGLAPRRVRTPAPAMIPAYGAILQTPLFAPDRRPEGQAAVQGLQLIGVAAYGRSAASAIVRTTDGADHVLKAGETLQGWRLVAVSSARAAFDGAAGRVSLPVTAPTAPTPSPGSAMASPSVAP
jgi:hypothetical protein